MRRKPILLALLVAIVGGAAQAQGIFSSHGPDAVSVTVYRDPNRQADRALKLGWLNGYALITETRHVEIPAGDAEIRFEGVAGGIIPESAIVSGLPDGVVEKNQDAQLLSPASLLDRSLGKRVHIRRTSRATGAVREEDAVIRSGADGAVVIQTEAGFEALRCTGIPETLVYDQVPEGLSAKPTLSVRTRSMRAARATVSLSYLATGFDWQANYVATVAPSGDRVDLFAWVTLANGDETSFIDAATQAVAGRPNREDDPVRTARPDPGLSLRCWPSATTSDVTSPPPPAPPPAAPEMMQDIVVTAQRVPMAVVALESKMARQEELGDLKLYRIPDPVTVAAQSQKQVAFLEKKGVKADIFYRARIYPRNDSRLTHATRILKTRNRKEEGLGLPLPAGGVVLFAGGAARPLMIGEGSVDDKAIGEDVEIEVGEAPGVIVRATRAKVDGDKADYLLTVTNDQARPVRFEAEFQNVDDSFAPGAKLSRRNGRPLWTVTVPANGSVNLRYRYRKD